VIYGKHPVYLGQFDINLPEVMYWLYLPVRMKGSGLMLPGALECCRPLIEASEEYVRYHHMPFPRTRLHDYVYLSARKGWATPDNPLNRPGWHCDGFGTDDLNFVWWDGSGTRFAFQTFEGIVSDHNRSLTQFDEQVQPINVHTYRQHGLFAIDPSVVHATPIIQPPGEMRQYVKISMSDQQYNLENNSHNYLFKYDWPMFKRETGRNDTGKDYYSGDHK
jgi:hypothetical protein